MVLGAISAMIRGQLHRSLGHTSRFWRCMGLRGARFFLRVFNLVGCVATFQHHQKLVMQKLLGCFLPVALPKIDCALVRFFLCFPNTHMGVLVAIHFLASLGEIFLETIAQARLIFNAASAT